MWPVSDRETMLMKQVGTLRMHMLCMSCSLTILGKAPCTSRKRAAADLPFLQVSLILWVTKSIASVVFLPSLPPNWVGRRRLCFSARKEMCLEQRDEKTFGIVSIRLIGR